MNRAATLSLVLLFSACAGKSPEYVVRYDLGQIAYEASLRDASPGFASLPKSVREESAPAARAISAAVR